MQRVESSAMCMCFFLFLTSFPIQPCSMLLACLSECKIEQGMRYVNHRAFAANKKLNSIIPKRIYHYGDEICLLDASYKTTKYYLPMFYVVVPTNIGYQVVGTFPVSVEITDSIKEALNMLSEWNTCWKPAYWLMD